MTAPVFVPGQRWVSSTESDLGLGIVLSTANRRVTISFPAAGEERVYAYNNAPLSRIEYQIGETVQGADGTALRVTERLEQDGYLTYLGVDETGAAGSLEEVDLDSSVRFNKPQDRLFAGQVDKNSSFQLRIETLHHRHRLQQSEAYGLLGPRVQLLPHQFFIAHQVARRHAPRVLLADEVGLGKTIEAGLIIHQQLISGRARRVLIVVPDSLLHQWLVEMLRRFNLHFSIIDEERLLAARETDDSNPFESAQCVLCSLSLLTDSAHAREQINSCGWDLMVVDEAHHLAWNETQASPEYRAVETLARSIPGVLLLTATPEQLGQESHFARLRLLDPDRYYDIAQFRDEEASYRSVNQLVQCLLAADVREQLQSSAAIRNQLVEYLGEGALRTLEARLQGAGEPHEAAQAAAAVVDQLLDRHGTGRVLFRNTRSAVSGFPERRLHTYPLPQPDLYRDLAAEAPLEDRLQPERLLGEQWLDSDPRVGWLSEWLQRQADEKILVICAQAGTARALEEHLRIRVGLRSAVFHEGMSLVARDRAAAYFAEREAGAQVLVCSEIGSEGRNFQFSQNLVLFDLPLNPDLLEQRIGRLDRIGQQRDVLVHVPFFQGSVQQALLDWLHQGLNAFLTPSPAAQGLFESLGERLRYCLDHLNDPGAMKALLEETRSLNDSLLEAMRQGRDRLLELNSCKADEAERILDEVIESSGDGELASYMERVFDLFGVEQQHHSGKAVIVTPGDHMQVSGLPGLKEEGITATYSRTQALHREDMEYMSWEHPMVLGAMEMIADGEFGNTALCSIKLPPIKPGTLIVETVFKPHCPAPARLQIPRYLPAACIRVVVDSEGNDLSALVSEKHINKLAKRVSKGQAPAIIRHARAQLTELLQRSESLAEGQQQTLIEQSVERMSELLGGEIGRLEALAKVNPNIRSEELEHLKAATVAVAEHLEGTQLQLDAIRVVIAT